MAATPEHVAVFIRCEAHLNSFVFLTHEGQTNTWFIPGGKVEEGETKLAAANRELREETGLILPEGTVLKEYMSFEYIQNEVVISNVTCFAADVPLVHFNKKNFRDQTVARAMAREVNANTPVAALAVLVDGEQQCLVCDNIMAKFYNFTAQENKEDCFSYGYLVAKERLKDALDVDAVNWELDGYAFRFSWEESPLWQKIFELCDNPKPLKDILKVTARDVTSEDSAAETGITPAMLKHLPKLQTISGKDEKILLQSLKGLHQQLTQRGMDPNTKETVQFVAALFVGELSDWWADTGRFLVTNTVDDLIVNVKHNYAIRDFEAEHLISLMDLKQNGSTQESLNKYIRTFNKCSVEWKGETSFRMMSMMFIYGLTDTNLKSEMMNAAQKEDITSLDESQRMPALQKLVTQAFLSRNSLAGVNDQMDRLNVGDSAKNKKRSADDSDDDSAEKKKKKKKGQNPNNPRGGKNRPNKRATDPAVKAAKQKLTQKEVADCMKKGKCLICQKTGHLMKNCPNK